MKQGWVGSVALATAMLCVAPGLVHAQEDITVIAGHRPSARPISSGHEDQGPRGQGGQFRGRDVLELSHPRRPLRLRLRTGPRLRAHPDRRQEDRRNSGDGPALSGE